MGHAARELVGLAEEAEPPTVEGRAQGGPARTTVTGMPTTSQLASPRARPGAPGAGATSASTVTSRGDGRDRGPGLVAEPRGHGQGPGREPVAALLERDGDDEHEEREEGLGLPGRAHLHGDGARRGEERGEERRGVRGEAALPRPRRSPDEGEQHEGEKRGDSDVHAADVAEPAPERHERYLQVVKEREPHPVDGEVARVGEDGPRNHVVRVRVGVDLGSGDIRTPRARPPGRRRQHPGPPRTGWAASVLA